MCASIEAPYKKASRRGISGEIIRQLLGSYQSCADDLIKVLDDLHQMSTCRSLVEAALKNHPLSLQTVAQAKAADSASSVNDVLAARKKRGRPVKEKGAQKAAAKPSRKRTRAIF